MAAPDVRSSAQIPTTPGSLVHANAEGRHVLPLASTHACTVGAEGMPGPRGCWRSSCVSKRSLAPSRLGVAHVTVTPPRPVESQPADMRGWLMPSPDHTGPAPDQGARICLRERRLVICRVDSRALQQACAHACGSPATPSHPNRRTGTPPYSSLKHATQ